MALHALELLPDRAGQAVVRRDWRALRDAGLPSLLDHHAETNAPHLTVVAAPALPEAAVAVAVAVLGPLLPVRVQAAGLLLLGGTRVTVTRAVDVDDDLVRAALEVRRAVGDRQHLGWLPHITLARRMPREQVQRAVDVLGYAAVSLSLVELRRWDPGTRQVTTLASAGSV